MVGKTPAAKSRELEDRFERKSERAPAAKLGRRSPEYLRLHQLITAHTLRDSVASRSLRARAGSSTSFPSRPIRPSCRPKRPDCPTESFGQLAGVVGEVRHGLLAAVDGANPFLEVTRRMGEFDFRIGRVAEQVDNPFRSNRPGHSSFPLSPMTRQPLPERLLDLAESLPCSGRFRRRTNAGSKRGASSWREIRT